MSADTGTSLSPEPGRDAHEALLPYATVVPYSNLHSLTSASFGSTVPFRVADVSVIDVARSVYALGAAAAASALLSTSAAAPTVTIAAAKSAQPTDMILRFASIARCAAALVAAIRLLPPSILPSPPHLWISDIDDRRWPGPAPVGRHTRRGPPITYLESPAGGKGWSPETLKSRDRGGS